MTTQTCDRENRERHYYLKFIALLQAATFITMLVYFLRIQTSYANFYRQPQACASKTSIDKFMQFEEFYKIVFWSNLAGFILVLAFLASYPHLSYRYALLFTCAALFIVGGVCVMSYSAIGFSNIQNDLRNEPPECKQMFNDLKNLFLAGLVIGVAQTALAAYCGYDAWKTSPSRSSTGYWR